MDPLVVNASLVIPAESLAMTAVRASGPGGQNVNKVASKVELRFDLAGCEALGNDVKQRLRALAGKRVDEHGTLLLTSQKTRDQSRNLEDARERLREMVAQALVVPKARRATKPSRRAKQRRLDDKKAVSARKRDRTGGRDD